MQNKKIVSRSLAIFASTFLFASYSAAAEPVAAWEGPTSPEIAQALVENPQAVQISESAISWNDGSVILTFVDDADGEILRANFHGCPAGYFCFYDAQNWNEGTSGYRRLAFKDCSKSGTNQRLSGFDKNVTSWVVHKASVDHVNVYKGSKLLWRMDNNATSANVGPANNDKADNFTCYSK